MPTNHYFNVIYKDDKGVNKKITTRNVVFATGKYIYIYITDDDS